jgi:deoxyinosine 3'endonuclease (endonuclease V)
MPYITCTYCKNIVVNCGHSLTLATFLVVCQSCYDRGEFLPQTMARYSLI